MSILIQQYGDAASIVLLHFSEKDDLPVLNSFITTLVNRSKNNNNKVIILEEGTGIPESSNSDTDAPLEVTLNRTQVMSEHKHGTKVSSLQKFTTQEDTVGHDHGINSETQIGIEVNKNQVTWTIPTPTVELDNEGLPWDARVHSGKKTKTSDGRWRLIRNVDSDLVSRVKSELRLTMNIPHPAPLPIIPAVPVSPPPPPPAPVFNSGAALFGALINRVTEALGAGRLTQAQLVDICKSEGLPSLPAVSNRPDLIPAIDAKLTAILGA